MNYKKFEIICGGYWKAKFPDLQKDFPLEIGFSTRFKRHKFDLGSKEKMIVMECKAHTWTCGDNIPSAKISIWIQEMLYFSLLSIKYRKMMLVNKSCNTNGKSLCQHFIDNYFHLIPEGVEFWEYDSCSNEFHRKF